MIEKIMLNKSPRGNDKIRIYTNDETIKILIEKNAPQEEDWKEHDSFYEVDGLKYYIFLQDDFYYALCLFYTDVSDFNIFI